MKDKMNRIAVIPLLVVSLSACTSVKYVEQDLNQRLQYDEQVASQYQTDYEWWHSYNDPQLNQLINTALENNIDFAKSAIAVNKALYQAKLLGADLVPSFSASTGGSVSKNIDTGGPSSRSFTAKLGLNYELDLWRKLHDSSTAQEWEYNATIEDKEAAKLVLINNVIDSYYNLAYLNDALTIGQQNLKRMQDMNRIIQAKYQYGRVSGLEVSQSKQSLLSAENTLLDLNNQKKTAEQTLRNLLNLTPSDSLKYSYPHLLDVTTPEVNLDVPLSVLANRPDLKAAQYRLQKAFKNTEAVEKNWYPTISLGASLSSSSDHVSTLFNVPFAGGNVAINLPFLQWNTIKWNVKTSQAEFENQKLTFEKTLTTALNEVDNYYDAYKTAKQTLENNKKKYNEDLKISNFYKARYDNGASELSDWLGALNTESSSKQNLINNHYKVIQYANTIYQAMAGRYHKNEVVTNETTTDNTSNDNIIMKPMKFIIDK